MTFLRILISSFDNEDMRGARSFRRHLISLSPFKKIIVRCSLYNIINIFHHICSSPTNIHSLYSYVRAIITTKIIYCVSKCLNQSPNIFFPPFFQRLVYRIQTSCAIPNNTLLFVELWK